MKFDVVKSITIKASMNEVRNLVEDFKHWNSWSPWTVLEPSCPVNIEGSANEPGHSMSWDGDIIGSGKNTLESTNAEKLNYHLEFFKPWKSQAKVEFTFAELEDQTKVTWSLDSDMPFFMFFMIKTMKNMIGMDYDRGLKMLKEVAENGTVKAKTENNGMVDYQGFSFVGIQRTVSYENMATIMQQDFEKMVNDIVINGKKGAQHWVCIYPKFNTRNMEVTYIAAVSDEDLADVQLDSSYTRGRIADTKMLEIKHEGAYEFLGNAWTMGMMYLRAKKIKGKKYPFEQYWNNPADVKPEELLTSVYFPVK